MTAMSNLFQAPTHGALSPAETISVFPVLNPPLPQGLLWFSKL